ncbi:Holliday junction resolvase RecU [Lacticaseibacillus zhaodongensis]|uniref:Holliday junction resolvase RecU n=1 Tax=Lacticaseibacillus zhaodongensis TaxID=2668065 RepID=UPI0012D2B082|nr:Holliday junction resolvase RecU [Lacticaseibacillus zhaodongensis]
MPIHYPNGNLYARAAQSSGGSQPARKITNKPTIYGGRGMTLEDELNASNAYYLQIGKAVVHKKPTPIQIVRVDYPARSKAVIKEGYFKTPSTTDYNGVYRGYYIDFEAKETKNKASFPLKNFHQHQIDHMRACLLQGGVCFVVMRFAVLHRLFVYPASPVISAWDAAQVQKARKSITLPEIEQHGFEVKPQLSPAVPYLDGVDWLIAKKEGAARGE